MRELTNQQFKRWYIEAVRADLILNHMLLPEEADKVIQQYNLLELVEEFKEMQLREEPRKVTAEMKEAGLF